MARDGVRLRKILVSLSGARSDALDQCPTERGKFEGIGGAVLTTSVLATLSMWFALYSAIGANPFVAAVVALAWGLAIMSLDRWLVGTIPAEGGRRWRLAMPRIALAVLLGAVISTPLVLQIFRAEIDAQIVEIKQRRANSFAAEQERGNVGRELVAARNTVNSLQRVIASRGDVPLDPSADARIRGLTQQREAQRKVMDDHYQEWQCQLYGGDDCPRRGAGPLAAASRTAYLSAKSRFDDLNGQIEDRKRELTEEGEAARSIRLQQAQADLPAARQRLAAVERRQDVLQRSFDEENRGSDGLLIRLQALNEASGNDLTLNGARLLLFLLFLVIECLPVAVKLMQRPGVYEEIIKMQSDRELRLARKKISPVPGGLFADEGSSVRDIWVPGPGESRDRGTRQRAEHPEHRERPEWTERSEWGPVSEQDPPTRSGPGSGARFAPPDGSAERSETRREEPSGDTGEQPSPGHEAIRDALDTRVTQTVDPQGAPSDGRPLYDDDDDF
jgi:hypothetical protein